MNDKVKRFLSDQAEKEMKAREDYLISLGLYEKRYTDYQHYSEEYPESEWDSEGTEFKYYKKEAIAVTDEEFEEIKHYAQINLKHNNDDDRNNAVAGALTAIAVVIFIAGLILGLVMGIDEVGSRRNPEYEWDFAVTMIYWGSAFISGMMFLGFAEIIKLLTAIKNKMK